MQNIKNIIPNKYSFFEEEYFFKKIGIIHIIDIFHKSDVEARESEKKGENPLPFIDTFPSVY